MGINQYRIVLVNLDPTIGSEIRKTRPCVVISPNEMNMHLRTIVIAPMTTSLKKYPTRTTVKHHNKSGQVALDQVRTVDRGRVVKMFGTLSKAEIERLKSTLKETYVD